MKTDPQWAAVVAELELRIEAQEAVVGLAERGSLPDPDAVLLLTGFDPPAGLPPLPPALWPELARLARRTDVLTARLSGVISADRPPRPARAAWRRPRGTHAPAVELDVRA